MEMATDGAGCSVGDDVGSVHGVGMGEGQGSAVLPPIADDRPPNAGVPLPLAVRACLQAVMWAADAASWSVTNPLPLPADVAARCGSARGRWLTPASLLSPATRHRYVNQPTALHSHAVVGWLLPVPAHPGAYAPGGSGLCLYDGVRPIHVALANGHPRLLYACIMATTWALRHDGHTHQLLLQSPTVVTTVPAMLSAWGPPPPCSTVPPAAAAAGAGCGLHDHARVNVAGVVRHLSAIKRWRPTTGHGGGGGDGGNAHPGGDHPVADQGPECGFVVWVSVAWTTQGVAPDHCLAPILIRGREDTMAWYWLTQVEQPVTFHALQRVHTACIPPPYASLVGEDAGQGPTMTPWVYTMSHHSNGQGDGVMCLVRDTLTGLVTGMWRIATGKASPPDGGVPTTVAPRYMAWTCGDATASGATACGAIGGSWCTVPHGITLALDPVPPFTQPWAPCIAPVLTRPPSPPASTGVKRRRDAVGWVAVGSAPTPVDDHTFTGQVMAMHKEPCRLVLDDGDTGVTVWVGSNGGGGGTRLGDVMTTPGLGAGGCHVTLTHLAPIHLFGIMVGWYTTPNTTCRVVAWTLPSDRQPVAPASPSSWLVAGGAACLPPCLPSPSPTHAAPITIPEGTPLPWAPARTVLQAYYEGVVHGGSGAAVASLQHAIHLASATHSIPFPVLPPHAWEAVHVKLVSVAAAALSGRLMPPAGDWRNESATDVPIAKAAAVAGIRRTMCDQLAAAGIELAPTPRWLGVGGDVLRLVCPLGALAPTHVNPIPTAGATCNSGEDADVSLCRESAPAGGGDDTAPARLQPCRWDDWNGWRADPDEAAVVDAVCLPYAATLHADLMARNATPAGAAMVSCWKARRPWQLHRHARAMVAHTTLAAPATTVTAEGAGSAGQWHLLHTWDTSWWPGAAALLLVRSPTLHAAPLPPATATGVHPPAACALTDTYAMSVSTCLSAVGGVWSEAWTRTAAPNTLTGAGGGSGGGVTASTPPLLTVFGRVVAFSFMRVDADSGEGPCTAGEDGHAQCPTPTRCSRKAVEAVITLAHVPWTRPLADGSSGSMYTGAGWAGGEDGGVCDIITITMPIPSLARLDTLLPPAAHPGALAVFHDLHRVRAGMGKTLLRAGVDVKVEYWPDDPTHHHAWASHIATMRVVDDGMPVPAAGAMHPPRCPGVPVHLGMLIQSPPGDGRLLRVSARIAGLESLTLQWRGHGVMGNLVPACVIAGDELPPAHTAACLVVEANLFVDDGSGECGCVVRDVYPGAVIAAKGEGGTRGPAATLLELPLPRLAWWGLQASRWGTLTCTAGSGVGNSGVAAAGEQAATPAPTITTLDGTRMRNAVAGDERILMPTAPADGPALVHGQLHGPQPCRACQWEEAAMTVEEGGAMCLRPPMHTCRGLHTGVTTFRDGAAASYQLYREVTWRLFRGSDVGFTVSRGGVSPPPAWHWGGGLWHLVAWRIARLSTTAEDGTQPWMRYDALRQSLSVLARAGAACGHTPSSAGTTWQPPTLPAVPPTIPTRHTLLKVDALPADIHSLSYHRMRLHVVAAVRCTTPRAAAARAPALTRLRWLTLSRHPPLASGGATEDVAATQAQDPGY